MQSGGGGDLFLFLGAGRPRSGDTHLLLQPPTAAAATPAAAAPAAAAQKAKGVSTVINSRHSEMLGKPAVAWKVHVSARLALTGAMLVFVLAALVLARFGDRQGTHVHLEDSAATEDESAPVWDLPTGNLQR